MIVGGMKRFTRGKGRNVVCWVCWWWLAFQIGDFLWLSVKIILIAWLVFKELLKFKSDLEVVPLFDQLRECVPIPIP